MLMHIFTVYKYYLYTIYNSVTHLLPTVISPVAIAFAIYVYFTNRRIKKSLKDEEFKNSKKGAFLDSFRAGLIVEAILSLTKISAGTAVFFIMTFAGLGIQGGVSYNEYRYIVPDRQSWLTVKPIFDWIELILLFCVSYGFQTIVKYFVMKLILKKNGHKLKFKEMFSGLLMSTLVGIIILIIEYPILGFLLITIKNPLIFK